MIHISFYVYKSFKKKKNLVSYLIRATQRHCVNGGPLMKMLTRCFLNTGFKRRIAVFFDSH